MASNLPAIIKRQAERKRFQQQLEEQRSAAEEAKRKAKEREAALVVLSFNLLAMLKKRANIIKAQEIQLEESELVVLNPEIARETAAVRALQGELHDFASNNLPDHYYDMICRQAAAVAKKTESEILAVFSEADGSLTPTVSAMERYIAKASARAAKKAEEKGSKVTSTYANGEA